MVSVFLKFSGATSWNREQARARMSVTSKRPVASFSVCLIVSSLPRPFLDRCSALAFKKKATDGKNENKILPNRFTLATMSFISKPMLWDSFMEDTTPTRKARVRQTASSNCGIDSALDQLSFAPSASSEIVTTSSLCVLSLTSIAIEARTSSISLHSGPQTNFCLSRVWLEFKKSFICTKNRSFSKSLELRVASDEFTVSTTLSRLLRMTVSIGVIILDSKSRTQSSPTKL
mmetsp:Transcript_28649/g.59873  ORF Transcript_28649/g.59873 Transcript_28649/m.59873 type:complete len:232 (+) Transcript_28649:226-921(+)